MKLHEYQLIIDFWKKNRRRLVFLIIATALGTLVSLSFPYILKLLIDGIKAQLQISRLLKYVAILFILGIVRSLVSVFLPFLRGRTNELFQWLTRSSVFKEILRKGVSFTNKFPSGDIIERLDQDLGELSWFACSGIFRPIEGIFTIIFALIILIKLNPLLTLISVLPISIAVFIWLKLGPLVYQWYRAWREAMSQTSEHIETTFSGIKLIKSYCVEQANSAKFRDILIDRIEKAIKVVKAEAKINIFFSGIAELGILLILWVGGMMVINQHLTLGDFVAFNAYILMLITPMFDIGNFFVAGRRAKAGEERIRALKEIKPDIEVKSACPIKITSFKKIEFCDVGFRYPNDKRMVLENINLTILPRMKIGIAGTVGSGKTTLIKLLLRICDPTQGVIYLDNIPYPEIDLESLRSLFGYAPQETALFSDTIYNNIVWGRENNLQMPIDINYLTGITHLAEDLKTFPDRLAQQIGERGLSLSGGQKQKVALARALYTGPDILILDDATSNLDADTEQAIIKNLTERQDNFLKQKTLIIISHRLTLLSICDIIYCLDKGRIIEKGAHQQLLMKKGLYWKLYQRQLLEKELLSSI
ncbi:MAG: ABC transporter ATP-binding protein/permease [candidate division WOR-3 bacterium]|nr:ABC transporter ATP-binding protein/permease [candidate division WOR-3 bacterium]